MEIFANVPVTALYAGLNGLIALFLAWRVTQSRNKYKVSLGDGGEDGMQAAIRAHANNAEYVPLALILLLIMEIMGGLSLALHLMGATLTIARILHGWGIAAASSGTPGRFWGTALTWLVLLAGSLGCIALSIG